MPGRGRRCERARPLLFLSPAAASAAEPLEGKRPSCQPPVASISPPLGSLLGPVASLRGRDHLLLFVSSVLPGSGFARCRAHSVRELPAVAGSPSSLVTSRFRGSPIALQLPGAGSARGERLGRFLCISATSPPRPGSCSRGRRPSWATGVPGARPQPPPSEVCRPPLPGWGKCASGRSVAGARARRLAPAGLGQVAGGIMSGILAPPGNPAFPITRGNPGGTCPAICGRLGKAGPRASLS